MGSVIAHVIHCFFRDHAYMKLITMPDVLHNVLINVQLDVLPVEQMYALHGALHGPLGAGAALPHAHLLQSANVWPPCQHCEKAIGTSLAWVQIHTGRMSENSFLGRDVDLLELAQRCRNFSGAEIEGLVKSAASFALNRQVDLSDLSKPIDEENLKARQLPDCTQSRVIGETPSLFVLVLFASCHSADRLLQHNSLGRVYLHTMSGHSGFAGEVERRFLACWRRSR